MIKQRRFSLKSHRQEALDRPGMRVCLFLPCGGSLNFRLSLYQGSVRTPDTCAYHFCQSGGPSLFLSEFSRPRPLKGIPPPDRIRRRLSSSATCLHKRSRNRRSLSAVALMRLLTVVARLQLDISIC